jgi:hypothetical protein
MTQSLDSTIELFHKFTECAGLRINIDKTEAIWIGSRKEQIFYFPRLVIK